MTQLLTLVCYSAAVDAAAALLYVFLYVCRNKLNDSILLVVVCRFCYFVSTNNFIWHYIHRVTESGYY